MAQNIDTGKLTTDIKAIKAAGVKLDGMIQDAALRAIKVADRDPEVGTGNLHFVNALYLALGKGARHQALTEWLFAFGGMKANTGEDKATKPFIHDKDKAPDHAGATENPWYSFAPSKKPDDVVDYLALALRLLKKGSKEGMTIEHPVLRDRLAAMVTAYQTEVEAGTVVVAQKEPEGEPAPL